LKRSAPLRRSQPLRSRGRKAARELDDLSAMRLAVHLRSGGFCEARTPSCRVGVHEGSDVHHRWPSDRDRGRHDAARCVLLCAASHLWAHSNPSVARLDGLLMRDGDPDPWLEEEAA
jgi:hypothetical protein